MAKKNTINEDFTVNRNKESVAGLKGLQGVNKTMMRPGDIPKNDILENMGMGLSDSFLKNSSGIPSKMSFPSDRSPMPERTDYYSDSKFDREIGNLDFAEFFGYDINDLRGQQQTTAGKYMNALFNNIAIAGSTAILGTAGFIYGIGAAIANNDISYLGNNSLTQAEDEVIRWADETAPIYRGKHYQSQSMWQQLGSATFWADLVKNLGYTEGMLVPGMGVAGAVGKLGSALGKAGKYVTKTAGAFAAAIPEASVEAVSNVNDQMEYKQRILDSKFNPEMNRAYSEGRMDDLEELVKTKQELSQAIQNDARRSSNFIFLSNVALLFATDLFEFGRVFGRGFESGERAVNSRLRKTATLASGKKVKLNEVDDLLTSKEGMYFGSKAADNLVTNIEHKSMSAARARALAAGRNVANGLSEYFEEMNQSVFAAVPEVYKGYNKFNEAGLDPEAKKNVDSFLGSWWSAIESSFGDKEQQMGGLQGLFIGMIGAPTYTRERGLHWVNSLPQHLLEASRAAGEDTDLAQKLNKISKDLVSDKNFIDRYKGVIRHNAFERTKNIALYEGDKKAYKDAENAQFVSDVEMFRNAGELDLFKKMIASQSNFTDEEIQSIIDDANGPFKDYTNKPTVEEVRRDLEGGEGVEGRIPYLLNKIDRIEKIAKRLESDPEIRKADLDSDSFSTLVFLASQISDYAGRDFELLGEIGKLLAKGKFGVGAQLIEASKKEGVNDAMAMYNAIEKLLTGKELSKEEVEEFRKRNKKEQATRLSDESKQKRQEAYDKAMSGKLLTQPQKFSVENIIDFLKGKSPDISKAEQQVLSDVVHNRYTPIVNEEVQTDPANFSTIGKRLTPEDYNRVVETLSLDRPVAMAVAATVGIKLDELVAETPEDFQELVTLVNDRIRIAASKDFYIKEYNDLYEDIKKTNKEKKESKLKKKVKNTTKDIKDKTEAEEIRTAKEEAGEDTAGKTDEELLKEKKEKDEEQNSAAVKLEKFKANFANSIRNAVPKSPTMFQAQDRMDKINQYLNKYLDAAIGKSGIDINDLSDADVDTFINDILSDDTFFDDFAYDNGSDDKAIKTAAKNALKDLAKTIKMYSNPTAETTNGPVPPEVLGIMEDLEKKVTRKEAQENLDEKIDNDSKTLYGDPKTPVYHIYTGLAEISLEQKEGKRFKLDFVADVTAYKPGVQSLARSLFTYGAFKYMKSGKVKVGDSLHFLIRPEDQDAITTDKEGNVTDARIYLAVTTEEDSGIEVDGKKYKIISVLRGENSNIVGIKELREKILNEYKEKGAKENPANGTKTFVSDLKSEITHIYRGVSNRSKTRRSVKDVVGLKQSTYLIGRGSTGGEVLVYNDDTAQPESIMFGASEIASGPYILIKGADGLWRPEQASVLHINDYWATHKDTDWSKRLVKKMKEVLTDHIINGKTFSKTDKGITGSSFGKEFGAFFYHNADQGSVVFKYDKDKGKFEVGVRVNEEPFVKTLDVPSGNEITDEFAKEVITTLADRVAASKTFVLGIKFPKPGNAITTAKYMGLDVKSANEFYNYLIDNDIFDTDLKSAEEYNVGFSAKYYDAESDSFKKGEDDKPQPRVVPEPEPTTPGAETFSTKRFNKIQAVTQYVDESGVSRSTKNEIRYSSNGGGEILIQRTFKIDGKDINVNITEAFSPTLQTAMYNNLANGTPIPEVTVNMFKDGDTRYFLISGKGNPAYTSMAKFTIESTGDSGNINVEGIRLFDTNQKITTDTFTAADTAFIKTEFHKLREGFKTPATTKTTQQPKVQKEKGSLEKIKKSGKEVEIISEEDRKLTELLQGKMELAGYNSWKELTLKSNRGEKLTNVQEARLKTLSDKVREDEDGNVIVKHGILYQNLHAPLNFIENGRKYQKPNPAGPLFDKVAEQIKSIKNKVIEEGTSTEPVNLDKELNWLYRAIPQAKDRLEVSKSMLRVSKEGNQIIVGRLIGDSIKLYKGAVAGTIYHEGFHYVFNILFDKTQRDILYKIVDKHLGGALSDNISKEEFLADEFEKYVRWREYKIGQKHSFWNNTVVGRFLSTMYYVVRNMGRGGMRMMRTFNKIYRGEYAKLQKQDVDGTLIRNKAMEFTGVPRSVQREAEDFAGLETSNRESFTTFLNNYTKELFKTRQHMDESRMEKEEALSAYLEGNKRLFERVLSPTQRRQKIEKLVKYIFGTNGFLINWNGDRQGLLTEIKNFAGSEKWIKSINSNIQYRDNFTYHAHRVLLAIKDNIELLTKVTKNTRLSEEEKNKVKDLMFGYENSKMSDRQKAGFIIQRLKKERDRQEHVYKQAMYRLHATKLSAANRIVAMRMFGKDFNELAVSRIMREYDSMSPNRKILESSLKETLDAYRKYEPLVSKAKTENKIIYEPVFENTGEYTWEDVEKMIIKAYPQYSTLLRLMKAANPNVKIIVDDSDGMVSGGRSSREAGHFSPLKNEVVFHKGLTDIYTLIHELIHAASSYGLMGHETGKQAFETKVKQFMDYIHNYIDNITSRLGKQVEADEFHGVSRPAPVYGFTDPAEFIAETFGNKEFQELLASIPAMEEKKYNSLFEEIISEIIDLIAKLFKVNVNKTALSQARRLGVVAMEIQRRNIDETYAQLKEIAEKEKIETQPLILKDGEKVQRFLQYKIYEAKKYFDMENSTRELKPSSKYALLYTFKDMDSARDFCKFINADLEKYGFKAEYFYPGILGKILRNKRILTNRFNQEAAVFGAAISVNEKMFDYDKYTATQLQKAMSLGVTVEDIQRMEEEDKQREKLISDASGQYFIPGFGNILQTVTKTEQENIQDCY